MTRWVVDTCHCIAADWENKVMEQLCKSHKSYDEMYAHHSGIVLQFGYNPTKAQWETIHADIAVEKLKAEFQKS